MEHKPNERAINDPTDEKARQYSEGLAKLETLRALYRSLNKLQLEEGTVTIKELSRNFQKKTSLEISLLEKGKNRAVEEYNDHLIKSEAFSTLAGRYRTLGLESQANAYRERGSLENAATRGFKAIIEAYDKKLTNLGVAPTVPEVPQNLHTSYLHLESAQRFLEGYASDIGMCFTNTVEVLKAEEVIRKLDTDKASHALLPAGQNQLEEAMRQRDRFVRMAEREAINAAVSFKHYQSEIKLAENSYEAFDHAMNGMDAPENAQDSQEPNQTGSDKRMNRLAVGMVVCQTLKVLDREL
jgi:uncharacterized phage infection (PIP) family protein YhgE